MADEDDDAQALDSERDGDEREDAGSEGDGTEREDSAGRDEDGEISSQRADAGDEQGASPSRRTAEHEDEPRGRSARERYQRLANENRELRERQDRLEREREQERQLWNQRQRDATDAQERERMNLMTPEERADYRITRHEQRVAESMRQTQLQSQAMLDKAAFDARCATSPARRRLQDEVEKTFAEQMRKGAPTDRETIYFYLLGQQADRGAANGGSQRRQARQRVERERVAPSSNRSSAASAQSRKVSTAEERLKDVLI